MSQTLTDKVANQYNNFQSTLEEMDKTKKYLNYGYTLSSNETLEQKQEQLCRAVFDAANIQPEDLLVDVGFGSGEQDFLLAKDYAFKHLTGFNIADKQVRYANSRAARQGLGERLNFIHSPAEDMKTIEDCSVDKVMSVECAFYFDRPRFYKEASRVLKQEGKLVLADISFCTLFAPLKSATASLRRVGTIKQNKNHWEEYFKTRSITKINAKTRQGCQMAVSQILREYPIIGKSELSTWLAMALASQFVVLGLWLHFIRYDLIVLEKK